MLELYTWTTPNGRKVSIMLEEIGLPYEVRPVNLGQGDQQKPEFLAINPNGKIPALLDSEGPGGTRAAIFESGAILIYLAEKTGTLLPARGPHRHEALEWLMYQMSHVGPILGQAYHFIAQAPERIPYAVDRFNQESARIIGVLNGRLADAEYLAGDYSIADIASYPWVKAGLDGFGQMMSEVPHVRRWCEAIAARPAVQRGMAVPAV